MLLRLSRGLVIVDVKTAAPPTENEYVDLDGEGWLEENWTLRPLGENFMAFQAAYHNRYNVSSFR